MSDTERIARLEQRLAVLETLVRQLAASRGVMPLAETAITMDRAVGPRTAPPPPRPVLSGPGGASAPEPAVGAAAPAPPRRAPAGPLITEEWLGQKGLLAVGVTFLVLAAGYLLKLSFEREWISPAVRCGGGALAGAAIAFLGWRLHQKGTRHYGAALIGAGAAIMYIAVWAAARLYEFLPAGPAVLALAMVAVGLAAIAYALDLEALGATAALGAFFAPALIGYEPGNANLLLLYLGSVGAGLGGISAYKHWRIATLLVSASYFGMAASSILQFAQPLGIYTYGILGGAAGLYVGLREGWFETRMLAFIGGWAVLGVANGQGSHHALTLLGGVILTAPVWWRALTHRMVWPDRAERGSSSIGETFYFYLSPIMLTAALTQVWPDLLHDQPGLAPALVALPYLGTGFAALRRPFALVGVLALLAAVTRQFEPQTATWIVLGLTLALAMVARVLQREDAGWHALLAYLVSLCLLATAFDQRPALAPALVDQWALSLWAAVAVAAWLARAPLIQATAVPLLWSVAGLLLLFGGTEELWRLFGDQRGSTLAGGLAVSAWWILFAAGCFFAGFRMQRKPLRLTGFLVAGCALAKVLLIDLSTLDAFYRIGSALILGVVCLAVAYVYHRGRVASIAT